jgi:hypothetical protein
MMSDNELYWDMRKQRDALRSENERLRALNAELMAMLERYLAKAKESQSETA